ncbi:MAG: ATP-binding cassette domain-containing protein [Elioraea sp.]|nr:ATP-binding cassette domain-containing protein [Elioraea sp.]MDW8443982.1 ATP-binding cassette domain-containing protein [Acetobacteraceae bacterium]
MSVLVLAGVERALVSGSARFVLQIPALDLEAGEGLALVGPSGAGKSTSLDLAALALAPDRAERLVVRGVDAAALWARGAHDALAALRARAIGYVPQTGGLLPFLTVAENIALTQRLAGRREPSRILRLAERLGIAAELDRPPAALSVGQRQRAAIARALAHRPALVVADEPTAALHPELAADVFALLVSACAEDGAALLVATHDAEEARRAGLALRRVTPVPGEARSVVEPEPEPCPA